VSAERLQLIEHLVRLARLAAAAEYAELVVGGDLAIRMADGTPPRDQPLLDAAMAVSRPTAGVTNSSAVISEVNGSFALHPITGPSAEPGSLLVFSTQQDALDTHTLDRLTSAVTLIESHLDQAVERIRLDHLSEVLRSNQTQLQDAQARLQMSNDELEQFAYIAAHELLAPLRSVAVYAEVLEMNTGNLEQAQLHSCVREIREGVTLMDRQMRNLLELSSTQKKAAELVEVDLNVCVQKAVDSLRELLGEAEVTIGIDELPTVAGQPVLLQSVFVNLIANSVKYRDPKQTLQITVAADRPDGDHRVRVIDNGPGIEPDDRDRIFRLFERASTSTAGSGIGLGLSRRIVEAFGGTISYESADSGGSCFALHFPAGDGPS